jgi:hypothetical protein
MIGAAFRQRTSHQLLIEAIGIQGLTQGEKGSAYDPLRLQEGYRLHRARPIVTDVRP